MDRGGTLGRIASLCKVIRGPLSADGREGGIRGTSGEMREIKHRQWKRGRNAEQREGHRPAREKMEDENGRAEMWGSEGGRGAGADRGEDDEVRR